MCLRMWLDGTLSQHDMQLKAGTLLCLKMNEYRSWMARLIHHLEGLFTSFFSTLLSGLGSIAIVDVEVMYLER